VTLLYRPRSHSVFHTHREFAMTKVWTTASMLSASILLLVQRPDVEGLPFNLEVT